MRILASILVMIFIIIYWNLSSGDPLSNIRKRTFWLTCFLAFLVFVQVWLMKPPFVNYGRLGWSGHIKAINEELGRQGSPNRLPEPGEY